MSHTLRMHPASRHPEIATKVLSVPLAIQLKDRSLTSRRTRTIKHPRDLLGANCLVMGKSPLLLKLFSTSQLHLAFFSGQRRQRVYFSSGRPKSQKPQSRLLSPASQGVPINLISQSLIESALKIFGRPQGVCEVKAETLKANSGSAERILPVFCNW